MPSRCGCASDQCSCYIIAGDNVIVEGTGGRSNPYVVSVELPEDTGGGEPGVVVAHVTGEITMWSGLAAPEGALMCNGAEVSRAVYADLFAVMGTSYGAGNGESTFNLPNLVGKFPMGVTGTELRGAQGGEETNTITHANLPPHAHGMNHDHASFSTGDGGDHIHQFAQNRSNSDGINNSIKRDASSTGATAVNASGAHSHTIDVPAYTGNTGNGPGTSTPMENRPPFVAVNFIVWT